MKSLVEGARTTNILLGVIALSLLLIAANLYGLLGPKQAQADAPQRVEVVNGWLPVVVANKGPVPVKVENYRPIKVWVSKSKYD